MLTRTRMLLAAAVMAAALGAISLAPTASEPAAAQQTGQAGLVNVNVGDVTIAKNVAVAAAVGLVANLCPAVSAQNIAILAAGVLQNGGDTGAICEGTAGAVTGPVTISEHGGQTNNQGPRRVGQLGLVNVNIGDVTILENVGVAAAVAAVANICPGVSVQNIALLAALVAQNGGETNAFCTGTANGETGPVTIEDAG